MKRHIKLLARLIGMWLGPLRPLFSFGPSPVLGISRRCRAPSANGKAQSHRAVRNSDCRHRFTKVVRVFALDTSPARREKAQQGARRRIPPGPPEVKLK